jgi:hypothetical protein
MQIHISCLSHFGHWHHYALIWFQFCSCLSIILIRLQFLPVIVVLVEVLFHTVQIDSVWHIEFVTNLLFISGPKCVPSCVWLMLPLYRGYKAGQGLPL